MSRAGPGLGGRPGALRDLSTVAEAGVTSNVLKDLLLPKAAHAQAGDPCTNQLDVVGSTSRKAVSITIGAAGTCAASWGFFCGISLFATADAINDQIEAQQALDVCRSKHPEYNVPEPCTSFCNRK